MPTPPVCRWCRGADLAVVLDLGAQPPADLFPLAGDAAAPTWPLRMALCSRCGLAQLVENPDSVEEPRGIEPAALIAQARDAVDTITAAGLSTPGTTVAEFDSPHGGSWRALLGAGGCTDRTDTDEPADLVVDVFGLMHADDQAAALRERVDRLRADGTLLLQFHSLASIVVQGQWNALRHGHTAYYSTQALVGMLAEAGLTATGAWRFPLYGGTVLLSARADGSAARDPHAAVTLAQLVSEDAALRTTEPGGLAPLADAAAADADELVSWLRRHRDEGRQVVGYGAASRAVPLLVRAGIGVDLLPAVADGSPAKQGRCLPVSGIPVIPAEQLRTRADDVVVLFVPDLLDEVRRAFPEVEQRGAAWAVSQPRPQLVGRRPDVGTHTATVRR